ncbi:MAG: lytic transglycosylase domain-containing protein [bacterium]
MRLTLAFTAILLGVSNLALGQRTELSSALQVPKGLEQDVKFWERVFTDIEPEECAFHDEWDLDVIYYIARVPRVKTTRTNTILKNHVRKIRGALANLSKKGVPSNDFERRILRSIPEDRRHRAFFLEAKDQVRCQRGVEFEKSLTRSRQYIPMIKRSLREKGLPEDLAYLPHLESGFDRFATSKAGAKGLWQFMPHTARAEGLVVRRKKDWRVDARLSTDAATDHLAGIFLRTRSWELAITAYNYGLNGVMRAIQKFGDDYMKIRNEHKTSMFGFAARNYYPSFLAVRNVALREEARLAGLYERADNIAVGESESNPAGESVRF